MSEEKNSAIFMIWPRFLALLIWIRIENSVFKLNLDLVFSKQIRMLHQLHDGEGGSE